MKPDILEKVQSDLKEWQYIKELPDELSGFIIDKEAHEYEDTYEIFVCENPSLHRKLTAYYDEKTMEYKLSIKIGLTEFCLIECIEDTLGDFEERLKKILPQTIADCVKFNPDTLSCMFHEKNILGWDYKPFLPDEYNGFSLFIRPDEPVKITNGSYIIFDYENFSLESNFIVYYNVFRDEFFGEARIKNIPDVNYLFDSPTLSVLEKKLKEHLFARLDGIKERAQISEE